MDAYAQLMDIPIIDRQTVSAYHEKSSIPESCLVTRVAYDIGSSKTKMMAAKVNLCNMTIDEIISQQVYPVGYREDLDGSPSHEFSNWIKEYGTQTLMTGKMQAEYDDIQKHASRSTMDHCAVATAAFREANNGESFSQELSEALQIPVQVISQEEEGKLAYLSAMSQKPDLQAQHPIVWDIGGGSMQLTFQDESGEFFILGNTLASQTFMAQVLEKVLARGPEQSPNPMTAEQIKSAIGLAQQQMDFGNPAHLTLVKDRILNGTPVIAVGSVHHSTVQPLAQLFAHAPANQYSKAHIQQTLDWLKDKNDEDLANLNPELTPEFVKNQVTNLILVYAAMDQMGIDKVQTLEASNVQGLLLKGC